MSQQIRAISTSGTHIRPARRFARANAGKQYPGPRPKIFD